MLRAAAERGRKGGAKPRLDADQLADMSIADAAKTMGIAKPTVYSHVPGGMEGIGARRAEQAAASVAA